MASITTQDGVRLHYEASGTGPALLLIHEFAGDHRSWQPQVRRLSARFRCITYAARGFPPSDVPEDPSAYSQLRAVADAVAVLDALEIDRAHVVGLSMGGFCALHLALRHPDRLRSVVVGACGYGAAPDAQAGFQAECDAIAEAFLELGSEELAETYAVGPARVQLQNKNPEQWRTFATQLAEHSALGSALTMRGVQRARPSLYDLRDELSAIRVPMLLIAGDEDEGCLEPNLMLKRTIPTAGLAVLPRTGHTCNLEEPDRFNQIVEDFLDLVAADRWQPRDPRALSPSITGVEGPPSREPA